MGARRGSGRGSLLRAAAIAVAVAAAVAGLSLALAAGGGGVASASHDPAETNFTFEPMEPEDRRPGAEDIRSGTIGQAASGVDADFETLLEMRSVYSEGSWADCGASSSEVFGIDRGGNNEPYEVDESLVENVKRFSAGEDVFETEFHDEDDWGASTHLNSEDRVFAVIECVDNPEEPGWYQVDSASVTGRTADGEVVTLEDASHYFWICECEDEAEAREQLGPPPSEPDPTPTSGSSGDEGHAGSHETDTSDGGSAGGTAGDGTPGDARTTPSTTGGTPGGDAATDAGTTPTPTGAASPTPAPADWNEVRIVTPARGDGPGFGPVAALAALLAAALAVRSRRW